MLRGLLLALLYFFLSSKASTMTIEIPSEICDTQESSSIISAVSTPTVDSSTSAHSSPLFSAMHKRTILKNVVTAQNLILNGEKSGEPLDFVFNFCRYRDPFDLFQIINSQGFEELAFQCAQNFQNFSWYYILDRVKHECFAEKVIQLLRTHELLLFTFGPRYRTDPYETSICMEANRANNRPVSEFIRQYVGEEAYSQLLEEQK